MEDQLNVLHSIECEHTLFEMICSNARELGFEHCAYGLRMPLPLTQPKVAMFNNYLSDWRKRYHERNYIAIDPTVRHGMSSLLPVIWSDDLFAPTREFWEDARSFGLHVGWAQASRDISGAAGMLTLARSSDPLSASELREKAHKMAWLTQVAHIGMSSILAPRLAPEINGALSCREIEVLRWTADGKTSAQIADIINITERTVNFHINNTMTKLNVANKTAAVAKAAILGLLF